MDANTIQGLKESGVVFEVNASSSLGSSAVVKLPRRRAPGKVPVSKKLHTKPGGKTSTPGSVHTAETRLSSAGCWNSSIVVTSPLSDINKYQGRANMYLQSIILPVKESVGA